ncbi:MAG: type III-A CRISPR-associated RAMP protein Csm4 [Saprospiraceae bacterium]|nr:MAG: type III-A CRISPR-associated RAMP protein Csm4 [Saprospiraceae bacterium]
MKIARIPLQPHSRFHFGMMKLDHDLALSDSSFFAHSDTLFSGLVNSYSKLSGAGQTLIDYFEREEIKVSSLLYYITDKTEQPTYVHFVPKPLFLEASSDKQKDGQHKKRNRIKFVSLGVVEKGFQADHWLEEDQFSILQDTFVITQEEKTALGLSPEEVKKISVAQKVFSPKSPQRAHSHNASIYYQTDLQIGDQSKVNVGWYCAYEAEGEAETAFKNALNVLAYTGIGGEVYNTGRTIPEKPDFTSLNFTPITSPRAWMNIALLNPQNVEEFQQVSFYQTVFRGGRMGTNDPDGKANVVSMIAEGALVTSNDVSGRLVELGLDEQDRIIYRNGKTLLIPIPYDV